MRSCLQYRGGMDFELAPMSRAGVCGICASPEVSFLLELPVDIRRQG